MTTPASNDTADVAELERLANLSLSREERERISVDLQRIVGYVQILAELDLETVEPTRGVDLLDSSCEALAIKRLERPSDPQPELPREVALAEAPRVEEHGFAVPGFVDEA